MKARYSREMVSGHVQLGSFDCPSGVLVLLDLGLAHHWERRGVPEHRRERLHDLAIEGADAEAAGLAYDRSYDPLRRYDIRDADRAIQHFADFAQSEGFAARAVILPSQVPHAERARRALTAREPGIGRFSYDRLWAVGVGELPRDRALPVVGIPMPPGEFAGRFRSIDVVIDPEATVARSERVFGVMVDHGQLACVDLDVLDALHARRPLDGKADYLFWGPDASALAEEIGAPRLNEREHGWLDLPDPEVGRYAAPIQAAVDERGLRVSVDYRPHCHVEQINQQVRSQKSRAGEIRVGDHRVCGFDNRWGDGIFDVYRDTDEAGRLVRIRMDVGGEEVQRVMRRVAHRRQGALITRAVLEDAEPARFVDRYEPKRRDDSGWVITSGTEPEGDPGFQVIAVTELTARYPELEPLLAEPVGARFRLVGDHEYEREA
ncbi:MAG: DUF2185 domain-containing protein [Sandaracinaceae bacterium]|nr:MAG: DUF2185 domain-containing protein [Sandaracinaceae bacterium]